MDTKDILIICLTIILAALIIVGAIFIIGDNDGGDVVNNTNQDNSSVLVSQIADNDVAEDSDVVSEEIKFNYQAGSGYYKEIQYKDGGFRQYDVDTGELIGSSYDSDQKYLPSME